MLKMLLVHNVQVYMSHVAELCSFMNCKYFIVLLMFEQFVTFEYITIQTNPIPVKAAL